MILKKAVRVLWATGATLALLLSVAAGAQEGRQLQLSCDSVWSALFTPPHPVLGRYEACVDPRPLSDLAGKGWTVETANPLDAFGRAGLYDRSALARLYGGLRPTVARRWSQTPDAFESLTLIFPSPDTTLTRLLPATLVIRWICDIRETACQPFSAR
jgi:hypothetical protein